MNISEDYKLLFDARLDDWKIGTTKMRRKLKRAGYSTLAEVFSMSEADLDGILEWEEADAILSLKAEYEEHGEDFVRKHSSGVSGRCGDIFNDMLVDAPSCAAEASEGSRVAENLRRIRHPRQASSLPPLECCGVLTSFESKASSVFDELGDEHGSFMAFQAFVEFAADFEDIASSFSQLLHSYRGNARKALDIVEEHFGDVFVIYVADRARTMYDDGNLWGRLFESINLDDVNVQTEFKALFVALLVRRGMPIYSGQEETFHYLYTAILHGGLSLDAWENLWGSVFLPIARGSGYCRYGFAEELDGMSVLQEVKNPNGRFVPKKSVLSVLEKASSTMIAPLFDAALDVASNVQRSERAFIRGGMTMVSSFGLPDVAMQALRNELEPKVGGGAKRAYGNVGHKRLVYLPSGRLIFDISSGVVKAHWSRQQFPLGFDGESVEYYVNGKREAIVNFRRYADKCILEEVNLPLSPQASYEVEIRLVDRDGVELSSMSETFRRAKPWCLEFVRESTGVFRLRGRNEKVLRVRRIAYLVANGVAVVPVAGMTKVTKIEGGGAWGGATLFIFDVEPGASGTLVDESTGEELLTWHECYTAKVDSRKLIGKTVDGIDLYGLDRNELGFNDGLPSFVIENVASDVSVEDLDVFCACDGKRVAVPRRIESRVSDGELRPKLLIEPSRALLMPTHANRCVVEVRQKNVGNALVFKYVFAIVPIQEFHLASLSCESGVVRSEYAFIAGEHLSLVDDNGHAMQVREGVRYCGRALLKDAAMRIRLDSFHDGKRSDIILDLAGIDVVVPKGALEIAERRPLCLIDALDASPEACRINVRSLQRRKERRILALLGSKPVLYSDAEGPVERFVNLRGCSDLFVAPDFGLPESMPLRLSVSFGRKRNEKGLQPAWADVELLPCNEGMGFSKWTIEIVEHSLSIVFDAPVVGDLFVEFALKIGGSVIGQCEIESGETTLALPDPVCSYLRKGRKVVFSMMPTSLFGEPEREYATKYEIDRRKR